MDGANGNRSRQIEETVSREKRKTHTRKKKEKLEKERTKLHDLIFAFLSLSPWKGCHVHAREANALQRIKNKKCIPSEKLVAAAKRQSTRRDE